MTELHPTILQTQPNVYKDTTGEFPQPLNLADAELVSQLRFAETERIRFNRAVVFMVALSIAIGAINLNFFSN